MQKILQLIHSVSVTYMLYTKDMVKEKNVAKMLQTKQRG